MYIVCHMSYFCLLLSVAILPEKLCQCKLTFSFSSKLECLSLSLTPVVGETMSSHG
jgi:hypothetical protein